MHVGEPIWWALWLAKWANGSAAGDTRLCPFDEKSNALIPMRGKALERAVQHCNGVGRLFFGARMKKSDCEVVAHWRQADGHMREVETALLGGEVAKLFHDVPNV